MAAQADCFDPSADAAWALAAWYSCSVSVYWTAKFRQADRQTDRRSDNVTVDAVSRGNALHVHSSSRRIAARTVREKSTVESRATSQSKCRLTRYTTQHVSK